MVVPYRNESANQLLLQTRERLIASRERRLAEREWALWRWVANSLSFLALAVALFEPWVALHLRCPVCGAIPWSGYFLVVPLLLLAIGLPSTVAVQRRRPAWLRPARFALWVTSALLCASLVLGVAGDRLLAPGHDPSHERFV